MPEICIRYRGQPFVFSVPDERDHIYGVLRWRATFYELDLLESLEGLLRLRPPGLIVDVGAYIGTHTVFFSKFCPCSHVVAFEPNGQSAALLRKNLAANRVTNVEVLQAAAGDQVGWVRTVSVDPKNAGSNRVASAELGCPDAVPIFTLDRVIKTPTAAVKIDVEGAEAEVLRGSRELLSRCRPVLSIEMAEPARVRDVLEVLGGTRYVIRGCYGFTPTYVMQWTESRWFKPINLVWLALSPRGATSRRFCGMLARALLAATSPKSRLRAHTP